MLTDIGLQKHAQKYLSKNYATDFNRFDSSEQDYANMLKHIELLL